MAILGLIKLCLSTGTGACPWSSWCIKPECSTNSSWAMTPGNRQLSGRCTQVHHLSSWHGQRHVNTCIDTSIQKKIFFDTILSSSGLWFRTSLHPLWPPGSHCGSARKGSYQLIQAWTQNSWICLIRDSGAQKVSYFLANFLTDFFILVDASGPQRPCGEYPQLWPHNPKSHLENVGQGVDLSLMIGS